MRQPEDTGTREESRYLHLADENYAIRKRDGKIVPFEQERITQAIYKSMEAVDLPDRDEAIRCSNKVCKNILEHLHHRSIPAVEQIQDVVEEVLVSGNHAKTVKAYILYREQHARVRDTRSLALDIQNTMDGYLHQSDWRVRENSNVDYSLGGLILHNSGTITANYWLNSMYTKDISQAHRNGAFHIHDLSMFSGYCAGWSLKQLLEQGLGGVSKKISSKAANHLSTLVAQMVNFLGVLQNEWAGAQAFSSFDTYLAPFIRHDKLSYKEVKQNIQSFIFGVNIPSRWGSQAPFTNITLDWVVPSDLKDEQVIIGGEPQDSCYGEYQKEMDLVNKAFLEVMMEGDAAGRGFPYPIPTYNITEEFDWESENARLLFQMTAKYGTPYFQNFLNSDLKPSDVRSMCCRLQLDKRELKKKGGGLFGAAELTGSIGVVTINMPRLGHLSRTREELFDRLTRVMDLARDSLEIKRRVITKLMGEGLFPYSKRYLGTWDNHFSTIGLVGMNECCTNFINKDLTTEEGRELSVEVLDYMRERLIEYQEATGNLYNLEATPAESTSYRLAKIDKERYPDLKAPGEDAPFYTNSSQLPVEYTSDMFHALDLQEGIQRKYTGGTVFHCFLGESIDSVEGCKKLVRSVAENYQIPYYTISPTFSICSDHGYLKGEQVSCQHCGRETEVYARIVGYYRPVKNWNKGKAEEYKERNLFELEMQPNVLPLHTSGKKGRNKETAPSEPHATEGTGARKLPVLELTKLRESSAGRVNGSSQWKLFTKQNCDQCDKVKESLTETDFQVEIYDLHDTPGRKLFTQYYRQIRETFSRKSTGEMDLPVLLDIDTEGQVSQYAVGPKAIEEILQSSKSRHSC